MDRYVMPFAFAFGFCCNSISAAIAQKTVAIPAPFAEINGSVSIIYCDAILVADLKAAEKDTRKNTGPGAKLTATIDDRGADRLVIEIDGPTLYVHHRDDFEKGTLDWGHLAPLAIAKGSAKQGIIAFGIASAPKSSTVSVLTLNRTTGAGLWTLSKDTLWAKDGPRAEDYPAATAMYLRCGARSE